MARTHVGGLQVAAVPRNAWRTALVLGFATLTAIGAYVVVPLPGSPVPVTLQTLFVTLSGLLLGPALGAAAQAVYLGAGAAGAPVFMGGMAGLPHLFGPTGGYLIAFPAAAWVVGMIAGPTRRAWQRSAHADAPGDASRATEGAFALHLRFALAAFVGSLVIFAGGVAQLTVLTGDAEHALRIGVLPFLLGDALKIAVATLVAARLGRRIAGLI